MSVDRHVSRQTVCADCQAWEEILLLRSLPAKNIFSLSRRYSCVASQLDVFIVLKQGGERLCADNLERVFCPLFLRLHVIVSRISRSRYVRKDWREAYQRSKHLLA